MNIPSRRKSRGPAALDGMAYHHKHTKCQRKVSVLAVFFFTRCFGISIEAHHTQTCITSFRSTERIQLRAPSSALRSLPSRRAAQQCRNKTTTQQHRTADAPTCVSHETRSEPATQSMHCRSAPFREAAVNVLLAACCVTCDDVYIMRAALRCLYCLFAAFGT